MKKKLAVFTLSLGSGGTERFISLLLPKLTDDFEVYLILINDIRHFDIPQNVTVFILCSKRNLNVFDKIGSFPTIVKKYLDFLSSTKIDISFSLLTRPNIINAIVKIFHRSSRIVLSERCYPSIAYKSSRLRFYLYKILIPLFYNKADTIFSNSFHINNDLKYNFRVHKPMNVVYNPVIQFPIDEIKNIEKQYDIIWVGKLVEIKNPKMLLEALGKTANTYTTQVLGSGHLEVNLKNYSLKNIFYKGNVKNVFEYIKNSKCLILTSNSDGFPNVILEGMSCWLPVIATNCTSGPLEILNDNISVEIPNGEYILAKFGILVNVNDSVALAKAIDKLFSDSILYSRLTILSYERAKRYSLENTYDELYKILTTIN